MDKEARRMLMPFVMEDTDIEKGLHRASPTTTGSSVSNEVTRRNNGGGGDLTASDPSIVVRGTRIRFRVLGIVAVTVIPVFAILFVMLLSVIIIYTLVPIPDIYIQGDVSGVMNASLGTLGHAVINPNVNLKLKIML